MNEDIREVKERKERDVVPIQLNTNILLVDQLEYLTDDDESAFACVEGDHVCAFRNRYLDSQKER